jgi:uncharacterized protein (DUF169 family)
MTGIPKLQNFESRLNGYLKLSSSPVAVKLFKKTEDLDQATKRRPANKVAICQLFGQARYLQRVIGGTAGELGECAIGAAAFGLADYPEDVREGKRMVGIYHATEEVGKRVFAEIPKFDLGTYEAILAAPLHGCPVEPDVIIFFGNSAQMLRLIHAHVWKTGERLKFSCVGEVVCADVVVEAMKTGRPSLSVPCNGARILSAVQDSELMMGIPYELIKEILNGLEATSKGGVRYPPAFQMVYLTPQPPVSHRIGRKPPHP